MRWLLPFTPSLPSQLLSPLGLFCFLHLVSTLAGHTAVSGRWLMQSSPWQCNWFSTRTCEKFWISLHAIQLRQFLREGRDRQHSLLKHAQLSLSFPTCGLSMLALGLPMKWSAIWEPNRKWGFNLSLLAHPPSQSFWGFSHSLITTSRVFL